jgi:hypothetical protein
MKCAAFFTFSRFDMRVDETNSLQFESARVSSKHRRALQRRPSSKWSVWKLIEDEDG